ncbi:MAG: 30S ribosomal protein S1 [Desulfohalobiaceae bacterium]|nr:30S ribosomal protein S1 [Desulfohalobiaceae bacterium]
MSEENKEKSFAELFESGEMDLGSDLQVGDRVRGEIIALGQDLIYVDTGTKTDGVAEKQDLLDDQGCFPYTQGDSIELFVVSRKRNEIRLAPTMGGRAAGLEQLEQAMQRKIPVEGKVKETCKGGFRVRVMNQTAFCPLSQISIRPVEDPESLVGENLRFLISRIEDKGRNIVVSRRDLLEREQAESLEAFKEKARLGDVLEGTVTRVEPYGAFVEVAPGLEGLVHVSELDWSRSVKPEEQVAPGDKVRVKFLSLAEQDRGRVRLELSIKQTQTDPWEELAPKLEPGSLVSGTVTRTAPFGCFVEISPGIEGLVHISEMSYLKRVHKPEDEVAVGQEVPVMIKDVDLESRRISLSLRDAEGDPWLNVGERYKKGQIVQGIVEKKERFGVFIRLEPGVAGLLPISKIESAQKESGLSFDKINPDEQIQVMIEAIDQDQRRISLAPADAARSEDWKSYTPDNQQLGTLGEKLKQALNQKQGS